MTFRKLLKWTIADALDEVWSKSGVTPSKKTRSAIIVSAEKISQDMDDDFMSANKEYLLMTERWEGLVTLKNPRSPCRCGTIMCPIIPTNDSSYQQLLV